MKIAFLGMGAMGSRMATSLLAAGADVAVWNRTPAATQPLKLLGAQVAQRPDQAAAGADLVLAMLRDDEASHQVWCDHDAGALKAMRPGALAVEMSTLSLPWVTRLAAQATDHQVAFLDAPVVGSTPAAQSKKLIFLVGGSAQAVSRANPSFLQIGQTVHHVGPVGSGSSLKLMVNGLLGLQAAGMAEWLAWAQATGLDITRVLPIVTGLPVCSPLMKSCAEAMVQQQFAPLFPINLLHKDLVYALQAAADVKREMPLLQTISEVAQRAEQVGLGAENYTALAKLYSRPQALG
jgi:3-hydroxyisobutyrate dehydrogenase